MTENEMDLTVDVAELIRLQWNDSSRNLLSVCQRLLTSELLLDVEICCGANSLKAHRLVLAANSPFFESLIIDSTCKKQNIIIFGVPFEDLKALVHFMYYGEVTVPHTQLASLLGTAKELQVKMLRDLVISEAMTLSQNQSMTQGDCLSSDESFGNLRSFVLNGSPLNSDVTIKKEPLQKSMEYKCSSSISKEGVNHENNSSWVLLEKAATSEMFTQTSRGSRQTEVNRHSIVEMATDDKLKYLHKAIRHFNVFTNEPKTSVIWKYFGKLIYLDPDSGIVSYVDETKHYCSQCVLDYKDTPLKKLVDCNVFSVEKGSEEELYKKHLNKTHLRE